jgi:hypothetical protein
MKRVKELTQTRSKPIWRHFTADKFSKTKVTRQVSNRKHDLPKRMMNNPLTNIFNRTKTSRSTSKVITAVRTKTQPNNILTRIFKPLGKKRSTSRVKPVMDVEDQCIDDRFGDTPT